MNNHPFSLSGLTVLVTGASSGIGRATAQLCANLGATVILSGRHQERLQQTLDSLAGNDHMQILGDLTNSEFRQELVDALPPLDGCVFNAGIAELVPMRMVSEKHLKSIFSVNYEAPVLLTQRLLAKKKIRNGGSLVYVTARAEHIAPLATGIYSGAKAALTATVRSIALEHAKQAIRANCVSPGYVDTPMLDKLQNISSLQDKVELTPLGTIEAADIANGIAFLLTPASRWITRSALLIDGGLSLHVR
jgi:NAD(P)-dependent dehydrogenase (short-subunit alcohol dehydrogenase family)